MEDEGAAADLDDGEKEVRDGLSGSGLLLPGTRAWRPRVGAAAWLLWLPREEEEGATTGTTAAWGGADSAALEDTTATRGGGVSRT